jgi:hypothetical protein
VRARWHTTTHVTLPAVCRLLRRTRHAHAHAHAHAEGEFIRRTAPVAFGFLLLAQAFGLIFTLGNLMPDKPMLYKV